MEENKEKKLTYSELENQLGQYKVAYENVVNKNHQLGQKLNEITDILNIMPYYIDIIKNKDSFDADFVFKCQEQLKKYLLPQDNTDNTDNTEKDSQEG